MSKAARSILTMHAVAGRKADMVRVFVDADILGRAACTPGYIEGELLVPEDEVTVIVTTRWRGVDAYAGWLRDPFRDEVSTQLVPLIADERTEVYEVHRTVPAVTSDPDSRSRS